jgi:hypothetical protein
MALIVIEDGTSTNAGVTKHVYADITDLSEKSLAKAVLRISNMVENKKNIADVLSDFEETFGINYTEDKTAAAWHDGIQTDSHYTFILI